MVRTQIQLTERQMESLKRMSRQIGCSMAELVRKGVDLVISKDPLIPPSELRERAASLSGKFASGRKDLSRKHDQYLVEAFRQ